MDFVIHDWMGMVEKQEDLMHISLNRDERTDHLPQLLRDVIARLRVDLCTKTALSIAAGKQGVYRYVALPLCIKAQVTWTSPNYWRMSLPLPTKWTPN